MLYMPKTEAKVKPSTWDSKKGVSKDIEIEA
jgi:hypothetical protein